MITRMRVMSGERETDGIDESEYGRGNPSRDRAGSRRVKWRSLTQKKSLSTSSHLPPSKKIGRQLLPVEDNQLLLSRCFTVTSRVQARLHSAFVEIPELPRYLLLPKHSLWMDRLNAFLSIDKLLITSLALVMYRQVLDF